MIAITLSPEMFATVLDVIEHQTESAVEIGAISADVAARLLSKLVAAPVPLCLTDAEHFALDGLWLAGAEVNDAIDDAEYDAITAAIVGVMV